MSLYGIWNLEMTDDGRYLDGKARSRVNLQMAVRPRCSGRRSLAGYTRLIPAVAKKGYVKDLQSSLSATEEPQQHHGDQLEMSGHASQIMELRLALESTLQTFRPSSHRLASDKDTSW